MKTINWLQASVGFAFRSVIIPIHLSPGLFSVVVEQTNRQSIVNAGRTFQRIWLHATELGLSIQPFAAASIHSVGFSSESNSDLAKDLAQYFNGKHLVVAARIGFNRSPSPFKSGRRDAMEFIGETSESVQHKR